MLRKVNVARVAVDRPESDGESGRARSENNVSVLGRFSEIIGMFSETRPRVSLDDVQRQLGISGATAYRYLSALTEMGMLSRFAGSYSIGPKVIELEHLLRNYDPVLAVAAPAIKQLSHQTKCDVLLCRIFGNSIINVVHERGGMIDELLFKPGRTMPLFRGSQARIILASLERRRLKKIYESNTGNADRDRIGKDWKSFSKALAKNRRDGYYISRGELDVDAVGIAAPILDLCTDVIGALVVVFAASRPPEYTEAELIELVKMAAGNISASITELSSSRKADM